MGSTSAGAAFPDTSFLSSSITEATNPESTAQHKEIYPTSLELGSIINSTLIEGVEIRDIQINKNYNYKSSYPLVSLQRKVLSMQKVSRRPT